jgi:hypothetical protein
MQRWTKVGALLAAAILGGTVAAAPASAATSACHKTIDLDNLTEKLVSEGFIVDVNLAHPTVLTPGDIGWYYEDVYDAKGDLLGTLSALVVVAYYRQSDNHLMIHLQETYNLKSGMIEDAGFIDENTALEGVWQKLSATGLTGEYAGLSGVRAYQLITTTEANSYIHLSK